MEPLPFDPPLYLIDAIGPFFAGDRRIHIDWSRLPWGRFEEMEREEWREAFHGIRQDLTTFCRSVAAIGYTGVVLDDLPHLARSGVYEVRLRQRIELYRKEFRKLFRLIEDEGLQVYLTMDLFALPPTLSESFGSDEAALETYLCALLDDFFTDFPEVAGVVIRLGEQERRPHPREDFQIQALLKTPKQVNQWLRRILPIFEQHQRRCLFRTWTEGGTETGDLIWREATLETTLEGITSPALVLSMRYGEDGFFRYHSPNRNFWLNEIRKIVELPVRREHEGEGEYPSFIGRDYETLAFSLREIPKLIGISVWCQRGVGKSPFRRLAFIDGTAIWTEINAFVTLRLFKHGELVEEAISHLPNVEHVISLLELLRLSEEVVKELLYLPDFARESFYCRKRRITPLLGIFGHRLYVARSLKRMIRRVSGDGDSLIRTGRLGMAKIRRMRTLALHCGLPEEDLEYMEYTFKLIALAREYYFGSDESASQEQLQSAVKDYRRRYPKGSRPRYFVKFDFDSPKRWRSARLALTRRLPHSRHGRFIDKIKEWKWFALAYYRLRRRRPKMISKNAAQRKGIDGLF